MNITVMILLLAGLVISALVCALIRNLLKAAIALSLVSAILSIIMFMMGAGLAAVFELSVCAGLITVVFISAISMTRLSTKEEEAEAEKARRKRFIGLPVLLIVLLGAGLFILLPHLRNLVPVLNTPVQPDPVTTQQLFWGDRQTDMLGQIIIVLAGVFGVLIFFKEREEK